MAYEPLLSYSTVTALIWVFVCFTVILSLGRYWIRFVLVGQFRADDFTHLLGLISMIICTALIQAFVVRSYEVLEKGKTTAPKAYESIPKYVYAYTIFLYISAWLIKANFLLLYWELFHVQNHFRALWRIVAVYIGLSFVAVNVAAVWQCGSPTKLFSAADCVSQWDTAHNLISVEAAYALHWSSEILLFFLPIPSICKLQMERTKKIALVATFSAAAFVILINVSRFYLLKVFSSTYLLPVNTILCALELSLNVILSTVVAYRALFIRAKREEVFKLPSWVTRP